LGLAPTDYKQLKGLDRENLRDHMTNLELIFTMLGEESTKQVSSKKDARGFRQNKTAAIEGGKAAVVMNCVKKQENQSIFFGLI
jgi:DNA-damage-inducible protein D